MITKANTPHKKDGESLKVPTYQRQESASSQTIYFWKEADTWSFSSFPPEHDSETWILDPNENIISMQIPEEAHDDQEGGEQSTALSDEPAKTSEETAEIEIPEGLPYTKIPQLIEDAKNIQKLSEDRTKQLESMYY